MSGPLPRAGASLGAAALSYAARGWHVFPCVPGTKRPATDGGFKSATLDEGQIRAWWSAMPKANVAAACVSFVVLDLDVKPAQGKHGDRELSELVRENGPIGWTLQAITPSGGTHHFFAAPRGVRISRTIGRFAPAIDVLGDGGYVLLAPSKIDGVGIYEWLPDSATLNEPSAWVLARMLAGVEAVPARPTTPQLGRFGRDVVKRIDRALKYLDKMDPSIAGAGGHDSAWRAACVLVHRFQLPGSIALECLRHFNTRCVPPWSEPELAHKIRQAQARAHTYSKVETAL